MYPKIEVTALSTLTKIKHYKGFAISSCNFKKKNYKEKSLHYIGRFYITKQTQIRDVRGYNELSFDP